MTDTPHDHWASLRRVIAARRGRICKSVNGAEVLKPAPTHEAVLGELDWLAAGVVPVFAPVSLGWTYRRLLDAAAEACAHSARHADDPNSLPARQLADDLVTLLLRVRGMVLDAEKEDES